jgi:hypothetical protein
MVREMTKSTKSVPELRKRRASSILSLGKLTKLTKSVPTSVAFALLAAGCGLVLDPDPRAQGGAGDGGRGEGGMIDGGRLDGRADADADSRDGSMDAGFVDGSGCVPLAETCNGFDDDCDGSTDEDFDFANDPSNCGACEQSCSFPGVIPTCAGATCQIVCQGGWKDCDGRMSNGCETDLSAAADCGDCGVNCGSRICRDVGAMFECATACAAGEVVCGGTCTDRNTDPENCGDCGAVCPSGESCVGGTCAPSGCDDPMSWGFAPSGSFSCRGMCGSATIYCDTTGLFCHCDPVSGGTPRLCMGAGNCTEAVRLDCCAP